MLAKLYRSSRFYAAIIFGSLPAIALWGVGLAYTESPWFMAACGAQFILMVWAYCRYYPTRWDEMERNGERAAMARRR